jgi:DNA-binding transcriptional MerR regulator
MNWFDLVPEDVAYKQKSWERRERVLRARAHGMTLVQVGKLLDVTRERVRQLISQQQNLRIKYNGLSPVERYLAEDPLEDVKIEYRMWRREQRKLQSRSKKVMM